MRAVGLILFNRLFAPMLGEEPDPKGIEQGINQLDIALKVIDQHLSQNKYFIGDEVTLADISMTAMLDPVDVISYDISELTHLDAWRKNMQSQSFYQDTHPHYGAGILV